MIRVGFGMDVHRFVEKRDLWIGGIKIPYEFGLAGHSDADVLIHAICDALLGAANLRDIGFQFPDNSDELLLPYHRPKARPWKYNRGNSDGHQSVPPNIPETY